MGRVLYLPDPERLRERRRIEQLARELDAYIAAHRIVADAERTSGASQGRHQRMSKLFISMLLWAWPFAAFALPHTFVWDPYTPGDATIYLNCAVGSATKTPTGNAPASANSSGINFDLGDQAGDIVACIYWAQKGAVQSPLGAEVSVTNPLMAPVGHLTH